MSAEVHAIYPPEPDLDVAIAFLKALNPDGRQALKSIRDENGASEIKERHFDPGMWDEKRALIQKWAMEHRNVYAMVNEPIAGSTDMKEESVGFIRALFSDTDHKGIQVKALAAATDVFKVSRPCYVNDSGGGIHTFWLLEAPVAVTPETMALAETAGRGLQAAFDGDHVWNINRIMRVPGTVNFLNDVKRKAGRKIAPTSVLFTGTDTVTMQQVLAEFPAPAEAPGAKVSDEAYQRALAEVNTPAKAPAVPSPMLGLWTNGVIKGDASGSGLLFRLAMLSHEAGFSGGEFAALAMNWGLLGPKHQEPRSMARAWAKASPGAQAGRVFADGAGAGVEQEAAKGKAPVNGDFGPIPAVACNTLPRREWLYGHRLIRGYLSSTIAAGGTGKSSLTMVEGVAMASGKDLLGHAVREPLRVLIWNGEDPQVELDLRYNAILKHTGLGAADMGDRLFVISGRDFPLHRKGDMEWLMGKVGEKSIDVVMIDPFVSSHRAPENDNNAIDEVAKAWSALAERCRCAVDLVHHIRKPPNGGVVDLSVDDARGASALVNASRNARVLSPMSKADAEKWGGLNRRAYFAIQHDATKANMVPSGVGADWFHFVSVDMGNGDVFASPKIESDQVGVVEKWSPPTATVTDDPSIILSVQAEISKGKYKMDLRAQGWAGEAVAKVMGLDLTRPEDRKRAGSVINDWVNKGWLVKVEKMDADARRNKWFVEVGNVPEKSDPDDQF